MEELELENGGIYHGDNCEKIPHIGTGYLHDATDDRAYNVDGVWYCGKCHVFVRVKANFST